MPDAYGSSGKIQGTAADGATAVGNPVQIAGVDGTGKAQALLVDADGTLHTTATGTQPVSGTVAATQSGTWTVGLSAGANAIGSVTVSNFPATQPVSGTVTANAGTGTFAVSAAALPLPTGASTAAKQPAIGTAGTASTDVITVQGIASGTPQPISGSVTVSNFPGTQPVSGTVAATQSGTWTNTVTQATGTNLHAVIDSGTVTANAGTGTFAISASALPLPTGAATAANQTNVQGTAGSPATTVLSVQGVASGTPQPVSGTFFQATQPVSGTVTANIGTSGSLALDATLTGGTQKSQLVGAGGNVAIVDANGNQQIKGSFVEVASLSAAALNADLVASTDVSAYKMWSLHVTGVGVGILTLQGSNDNTNWLSVTGFLSTAFTSSATSTVSSVGLVYGAANFRFMRVRLTTYTSGTFTGVIEYYTTPGVFQTVGGAVAAAQSGTWTVQPGNTPNTSPWLVTQAPATSGGASLAKILAAASTNSTLIIAGAHQLFSFQLSNAAAYYVYLHFYNKATAPTVGTDVPVAVIGVPPGGTVAWHDVDGTPFTLGIGYSITKGSSDTDTTAVAVGDLMGIITTK